MKLVNRKVVLLRMWQSLIALFMLLFIGALRAEMVDTFAFKNAQDRSRAVALAKSLRCPQCQNQNLVESNSPIAYDLRIEVYKMVNEGQSDQQIVDSMTARFGHFVLYNPPFNWQTALLWGLPILLLLCALILMACYAKKRAQSHFHHKELSAEQQQQLQQLLQNKDKKC